MWNLIAIALIPVVILISYVYFHDKHEREPIPMLAWAFVLGIFSVIPTFLFYAGWEYLGFDDFGEMPLYTLFYAFIVVALSEEGAKYLMMRGFLYKRKAFNEPYDGIMYMVMIGMGFAAVENLLYVFGQPGYGESLAVGGWRAVTAIPAHGAFAVMMGFFAGKAKYSSRGAGILLLTGLGLAVLFHGAYDFFLMQNLSPVLGTGALAALVTGIVFSRKMIRSHQRRSPFREDSEDLH